MKRQILDAELLRSLLHYDPESGVFTWTAQRGGGAKAGEVAGNVKESGYVRIVIMGRAYKAHRLAWLYVYGEWPQHTIDHRNRIRSDNRIANLRDLQLSLNVRDRGAGTSSPHLYVKCITGRYLTPRYQVQFWRNGKNVHIGQFATEAEAVRARDLALASE